MFHSLPPITLAAFGVAAIGAAAFGLVWLAVVGLLGCLTVLITARFDRMGR